MSTKEKYLIGVDRLDAQHRALFSAISRLKTILLEEDFERNKRICKEGPVLRKEDILWKS